MSRYIEKITVKKLFGHYDYGIQMDISSTDIDTAPLIIIYGDNGSGKTTLLELLFYLTSTVDREGHKTKIANIKFQEFSVLLQGGIEIIAKRKNKTLMGSYEFIIRKNNKNVAEVYLEAELVSKNHYSIVMSDSNDEKKYQKILKQIKDLNTSIHYLPDNRKLISGIEPSIDSESTRQAMSRRHQYERMIIGGLPDDEQGNIIDDSVKNLENWIKKQVLQASRAGDKNTNTIYTDLIKRVSKPGSKKTTKQDIKELLENLSNIRKENDAYFKNGLTSKIETKEIADALKRYKNFDLDLIYNILEPYVGGLKSRLDSLRETHNIIELFTKRVNSYLTNKDVKYTVAKGLTISNKEFGDPIELKMLSSGERQLLLLFCNIITASDDASIFIIDEPEISLNVKWQRKLIQTILDFSHNKNVQLIFASHSIELLTGHKNATRKLENKKEKHA